MTSTTDTAGHPDVAEISDLTEGLLTPDRSTDVRRHLAGCEPCADVYASLEEIRGLLGSVPEPERMPADVAGRLDAALAAEAPFPAIAGSAARHVSEDGVGHVSRETSAPADHLTDRSAGRPAGRPRAATGPGRKAAERGRRRGRLVLGAVLTAAVLGAGSLFVTSLGDHTDHPTAHGTPTAAAGPFSGDSVQNQVRSLLSGKNGLSQEGEEPRTRQGESNAPDSTEGPSTLLQTTVPVPDCVRLALGRSAAVLGAKTGTYEGKAAYLVVVADSRDAKRVTAYVIDAKCVHQQAAAAGTVMLKQSVARL
ncbi:zf-HC2 domain-containing protein [Streptomyces sp. NPDC013455]|uniref:anti-sigma factor family protein n=1 Tax=Streptomyces sp. NPDC013455 TaxID=3155605 RepID=UPI0033EF3B5A